MGYLISVGRYRQLILFCIRLLVQCFMAWSNPQTGMDELSVACVHAADGAVGHSPARSQWDAIDQGKIRGCSK
jgi:hypothetical protein